MQIHARPIAAILALLVMQACATAPPTPPPAKFTYLWLPTIDARNDATTDRARAQLDNILAQRGYCQAANAELALAISAGGRHGTDSPGSGFYTGGFAVLAPPPVPEGFVQVDAYDARSSRLAWRVRLRQDATPEANAAALSDALATAPPPNVAYAARDDGLHALGMRNGEKALCTAAPQ